MVVRSGEIDDFPAHEELQTLHPGSTVSEDWKAKRILSIVSQLREFEDIRDAVRLGDITISVIGDDIVLEGMALNRVAMRASVDSCEQGDTYVDIREVGPKNKIRKPR